MIKDGALRSLRAILDYIVFYEIKLSRRPALLVVAILVWVGASMALAIYEDGAWNGVSWVGLLALVGPLAGYAFGVLRADASSKPHFEPNDGILPLVSSASPTRSEELHGFRSVKLEGVGFDGPIVVSDSFNSKLAQDNVDWRLDLAKGRSNYVSLLRTLSKLRRPYVFYGRQAMLSSILAGKALVNERKVAFAAPFPPQADTVRIFETDYFMGLCTSERSIENVYVVEQGRKTLLSDADTRLPFQRDGPATLRLPEVANNVPPISLHIGVDLLALTRDNKVRLPVQSRKTMWSQGMRAPLASGSADPHDLEGAPTLKAFIANAARRELSEEWGFGNEDLTERLRAASPEVIGYFRNVMRCGKPQFVTIARLDCYDHELSADESEVMALDEPVQQDMGKSLSKFDDVRTVGDLSRAVDNILERSNAHRDSVALLGAAYCLRSVIRAAPDRVGHILTLQLG